MKTIFIVFKKNEFGHTRISCFFYHIGQTVIFLLHSELGIDQILNRIEEQKGELTHCACLTSLVQLHHCAHIIYYIYNIHTVYTYYIHILRSMLIVQAAQFTVYYATHFDCFKTKLCTAFLLLEKLKFENRMCKNIIFLLAKISSFFWLKYRLSFG